MSMNTHLRGRLRNTSLPLSRGLAPLFEAVVNSIQAIRAAQIDNLSGKITVEILRVQQSKLAIEESSQRRGAPIDDILGFRVSDNGVGFDAENLKSFETLDSDYKAADGCRGIGRLLWLKAFDAVKVESIFANHKGALTSRSFSFTTSNGVENVRTQPSSRNDRLTTVHLDGFKKQYRKSVAKSGQSIATALLEHCLWYFVSPSGAPQIWVVDGDDKQDLHHLYEELMHSSATTESFNVQNIPFEITHLKLKTRASRQHVLAWCAGGRVVEEESISGKIPGLHGRISDGESGFVYAGYLTSAYLDEHVRPERTEFDIVENVEELLEETQIGLSTVREAALSAAKSFLSGYLQESINAGKDRVDKFVATRAPRYRPILSRISEEKLYVDPEIGDRELELHLHRQLAEIEGALLAEGHDLMKPSQNEEHSDYVRRLNGYLEKADEIKKSDLANYVFHRKVILDIFQQALNRKDDGKYSKEAVIHQLIMPLQKDSNEVFQRVSNLWLIDERLAFHNYLASDKPLSSMPILGNGGGKEPDLLSLSVFDEPLLVATGEDLPLASIVVVEIKRPMRNDAAAGEEKDPIEQALGYLERVRKGQATTARGRPIPQSADIPGFCYVICDLTPTMVQRCKMASLKVTHDHMGYFGFNENFRAYIEVFSFERLLNAATERNRAFFDQLGLPSN